MCRALEEMMEEREKKGLREGRREGERKGELKGKIQVYREFGLALEKIAEKLNITLAEVNAAQE